MYRIINKKKLYLTIAADCLGRVLFLPKLLTARKDTFNPEEIKEILIIRTAYIGDVVMTLPLLKPLRQRFTGARITFLTSTNARPLLENNPFVDEILTVDPFWFYETGKWAYFDCLRNLRKMYFDLVIETRGDIREILGLVFPSHARYKVGYGCGGGGYLLTGIVPYERTSHRIEYHLDIARYLGCATPPETDWDIYLRNTEEEEVEALLQKEGVAPTKMMVALHPGSRKELKCWSPEGYAAVADCIAAEMKATVLLTGAPDELPLVNRVQGLMRTKPIVLAGKTPLRHLAGVIRRCALFICNDSSPMHIAAAVKTPVVAIFGPSKSVETGPWGTNHLVVEKDFPCRYLCDEDVCHHATYNQCMRDITVADVLSAVRRQCRAHSAGVDPLDSEAHNI